MLNPQDLEKAQSVQLGLQQFERIHLPTKDRTNTFVCETCDVDFPCERMLLFMIIQSLSAFSAMIPSGNMGALLNRFGNKK